MRHDTNSVTVWTGGSTGTKDMPLLLVLLNSVELLAFDVQQVLCAEWIRGHLT
jgi:hypothetical protein